MILYGIDNIRDLSGHKVPPLCTVIHAGCDDMAIAARQAAQMLHMCEGPFTHVVGRLCALLQQALLRSARKRLSLKPCCLSSKSSLQVSLNIVRRNPICRLGL